MAQTIPTDTAALEQQVVARFIDAASAFRRARAANFTMMAAVGSHRLLLTVHGGAVQGIRDMADLRPLASWDFGVMAEAATWLRFWETMPAAGWHDVFALTRHGRMRIEGDLHPLMAHLQFVKDLLASPRAEAMT